MSDDLLVRELVEEALYSGRTPEELCREVPRLLPRVRRQLERVLELDDQCDVLFSGKVPTMGSMDQGETSWPSIPGYEVKGLLGRGGMGVVYRARHLLLERDVALKMLLAGDFASTRELERFFLEARTIANLSHPNIVQVHDVSERDGRPYFTMELVEGGTLAQSLGGTPQSAPRAAELVGCLADAVGFAHRSGIIHRDLKPSNVLLTPDGIPRVTDFGLARHLLGGENLTVTGAILGTPSYMAPEQIRGTPVDSRADVYALGAILYETLTGRPPFRAESSIATQLQVLTKDPVRPTLLNDKVPRDIETICLHCLHKDPARRYASAAELAGDLRHFLAHEPIHARPVGRFERSLLWGRRNPAKVTVLSFGTVLLGFAIDFGVRGQALARERRRQDATWAPRVENAFAELRAGEFVQARSLLYQVPDTVGDELRQLVSQGRRELQLVEQLDAIRLQRVAVTEGRFDRSENRRAADLAYEAAFRASGMGNVGADPEAMAERIRMAGVGQALIGALDDWSFCAGDGPRGAWLLDVARRADSDPSAWRERFRDPSLRLESGASELDELEDDLRQDRITVQLVVGGAERLQENGGDVIPLLHVVQLVCPGDFWANFALADVLRVENPIEAIRYAQAAVAIRPRSSIAHQVLGTALRKAGRIDESIEAYRQAVLVEPGFGEAHGRLGIALSNAGASEESIAAYREAIRLEPELVWPYVNLGRELSSAGRVREALDLNREAVRREPGSVLAHQNLAICLRQLGREREALASLRTAVELEANSRGHCDLGTCLASLGRFDEAEVELRRAVELDPADEDARSGLSSVLVQSGRHEVALDLYRARIAAHPEDFSSWDGLLELYAYLRRRTEYDHAREELLARFGGGDDPRVCERLGRACLLLPSEATLQRAVALVDRAVAADTSPSLAWAKPYFGLAKALGELRSDRPAAAIDLLRGDAGRVLHPLPELIRAMALHRTGAVADARRELASVELDVDWSPAAAGQDRWLCDVLRREAEALIVPELPDLLQRSNDPGDEDALAAVIGACVSASRFAAAARLYQQVLRDLDDVERNQRIIGARTLARAGAGLGVDPADPSERARFRTVVREWVRADLESCRLVLPAGGSEARVLAHASMSEWLHDPAFAVVRDAGEMEELPPDEQDECRALWRDVEALVARLDGGD